MLRFPIAIIYFKVLYVMVLYFLMHEEQNYIKL
jgi:hypothetical protein